MSVTQMVHMLWSCLRAWGQTANAEGVGGSCSGPGLSKFSGFIAAFAVDITGAGFGQREKGPELVPEMSTQAIPNQVI